jgi:hypothetical protein
VLADKTLQSPSRDFLFAVRIARSRVVVGLAGFFCGEVDTRGSLEEDGKEAEDPARQDSLVSPTDVSKQKVRIRELGPSVGTTAAASCGGTAKPSGSSQHAARPASSVHGSR